MYKITIEKIERKVEVVQGEWGRIDERPYTDKELEDSVIYSKASKNQIKPVMGYAPDVKKTVRLEQVILEQNVEELDLVSIIKAINGIK